MTRIAVALSCLLLGCIEPQVELHAPEPEPPQGGGGVVYEATDPGQGVATLARAPEAPPAPAPEPPGGEAGSAPPELPDAGWEPELLEADAGVTCETLAIPGAEECAGTCLGTCSGACSALDDRGACAGACEGKCMGSCRVCQ